MSSGRSRSAFASSGRSARGACGAIRRSSSTVGSGTLAAIWWRSSRVIARASRAVGPLRAGVEACPPRPSTAQLERGDALLGDADDADRRGDAGERLGRDRAALVDHEPGPRRRGVRSSSTASGAAVPETSSLQPKDSQTSWAGREVLLQQGLDGLADRDQRALVVEGAAAPDRAVVDLGAERRVLPGRVRRRPGRRRGGPSARPGARRCAPAQWKSSPWVSTRVSSSRSCSSGNWRASSATNASNAAVSTSVRVRGTRPSGCAPAPGACRPTRCVTGRG